MAQLDSSNYRSLYQQLGSWIHMHNITLLFDSYQYYLSMVQTIQFSIARKQSLSLQKRKKNVYLPKWFVEIILNWIWSPWPTGELIGSGKWAFFAAKYPLLQGGLCEVRSVACCLNSTWYKRSLLTNSPHQHFHALHVESETVLGQMHCGLWLWHEDGSLWKPHCFSFIPRKINCIHMLGLQNNLTNIFMQGEACGWNGSTAGRHTPEHHLVFWKLLNMFL